METLKSAYRVALFLASATWRVAQRQDTEQLRSTVAGEEGAADEASERTDLLVALLVAIASLCADVLFYVSSNSDLEPNFSNFFLQTFS